MGLFSFIKDAGKKIFNISSDPTPEELAEQTAARTRALEAVVASLNIAVEGQSIELNDDTVTVSGEVQSQADKEKIVLALGNLDGVSTIDDRMTVVIPEPEAQFYEVKSGDSLSKIAKALYGDAMKYPEIFEANKPMLSSPDLIYPGQVLRIPRL